jgi:hypothetical protein
VLIVVSIGVARASSDGPSRFVARWGGHTKDLGWAIAADSTSVFVTGATWSADFPVTSGGSPTGDTWCAFLTWIRASNGAQQRSSALCGRGMTYGHAVTAAPAGVVWAGGSTNGPGLPASRAAAQQRYAGGSAGGHGDAFVARWNARGEVDYLTYLGGAGDETVWGVASDRTEGVWAAGKYHVAAPDPRKTWRRTRRHDRPR